MMSQIIMSTCRWRSCVAKETWTSFFETRVPIVVMYCSSNMFITYRRTRDVFPTDLSQTRQIFDLTRLVVNERTAALRGVSVRGQLLHGSRAVLPREFNSRPRCPPVGGPSCRAA